MLFFTGSGGGVKSSVLLAALLGLPNPHSAICNTSWERHGVVPLSLECAVCVLVSKQEEEVASSARMKSIPKKRRSLETERKRAIVVNTNHSPLFFIQWETDLLRLRTLGKESSASVHGTTHLCKWRCLNSLNKEEHSIPVLMGEFNATTQINWWEHDRCLACVNSLFLSFP